MKRRHLTLCLLILLCFLFGILPFAGATEPENDYPSEHSHYALLRLEDVGPGGPYETKQQLGQLRAVIDYLTAEHVPFHISLIPRDRRLSRENQWIDISIEHPDEKSLPFIQLMKYAQGHGGILGMHGYTHQYGDKKRPDGFENTSIGREFDVPDAEETKMASYGADRISKSLHAFYAAGLTPSYWESPHYAETRIQRDVFSSYMGILYEPDFQDIRSLKDIVYKEGINNWGNPSLGVVYIPAPLRYVHDESDVQRILQDARKRDVLASMYFHPYMEFPFLEEMRNRNGKQEIRDGLPVYRYKANANSYLHQLVNGMRAEGYQFGTIFDVVPFSPAHRIVLPKGATFIGAADLHGHGVSDRIAYDQKAGQVYVQSGALTWPRNQAPGAWVSWLNTNALSKGKPMIGDFNGDGRADLLWVQDHGVCQLYINKGEQFVHFRDYTVAGLTDPLFVGNLTVNGKAELVTIDSQRNEIRLFSLEGDQVKTDRWHLPLFQQQEVQYMLADVDGDGKADLLYWSHREKAAYVSLFRNGAFQAWRIWYRGMADARVTMGDVDGDGKEDLLLFYPQEGIWEVAGSTGTSFQRTRERFGPWGRGDTREVMAADLDGNKKADLLSYDPLAGVVDTALSFQQAH